MAPRSERRKRGAIDAIVHAALLESNAPIGAYGLIRRLEARADKVAPALMFRALNRLIAARRVARIESLSGYVATDGGQGIDLICTICKGWHRVRDGSAHRQLGDVCAAHGFSPSRVIIEVAGLCSECEEPPRGTDRKQFRNLADMM